MLILCAKEFFRFQQHCVRLFGTTYLNCTRKISTKKIYKSLRLLMIWEKRNPNYCMRTTSISAHNNLDCTKFVCHIYISTRIQLLNLDIYQTYKPWIRRRQTNSFRGSSIEFVELKKSRIKLSISLKASCLFEAE